MSDYNRLSRVTMSEIIYESHKQVKVFDMNRQEYTDYRGWDIPLDENPADEGFLVEYLDGGKPNDSRHTGYISWTPKKQFVDGYCAVGATQVGQVSTTKDGIHGQKSFGNTDTNTAKSNVPDIVVWGVGDGFKLISKASSDVEKWMKSTKAMTIPGVGCLVQVTTQQGSNVAEALQMVYGVEILETYVDGVCNSRILVPSEKGIGIPH